MYCPDCGELMELSGHACGYRERPHQLPSEKALRARRNADESFSKLRDENDRLTAELASLRSRVKELERSSLEILGAQSCPYCPNVGYYSEAGSDGEEEQVQCEWCETTPNSIHQVKIRLRAVLDKERGK